MGLAMTNIVTALREDGRFSTFLKAMDAAGITNILSVEGPFTVFAPTDSAFAGIPENFLEDIMRDQERATDLLTAHIVPERLTGYDLMGRGSVETLQGSSIRVDASADRIYVDDAYVVSRDIDCSNGVIHAIDTVLLPEQAEAIPA